jgi:type II secretory pathway pseudopilin PulG
MGNSSCQDAKGFAIEKWSSARRGLGLVEVIVVVAIVALIALMIVAALPRQRENARVAGCMMNLSQIGRALAAYDQRTGQYPPVTALGGYSPLAEMLGELGQPDFLSLGDPKKSPPLGTSKAIVERPIPGFTCPSDPRATEAVFPAPVSYRATTGDGTDGRNGPFAPGHPTRRADVEAGDGLAYTAAFAERLVGDGTNEPSLRNFAVVGGTVGEEGCPTPPAIAWRGDAGASWISADWQSTLYNHSLPPNGAPSCVSADGQGVRMGASSAHADRVHVLLLDGSVRPFTPRVDLKVWRGLANIHDSAQAVPPQSAPPR